MGSGMSSSRLPRGFVFDFGQMKQAMFPLLGLHVAFEYGRPGSARPPVTAALLAANVLVFLRPGALDKILPRRCDIAFNYNLFVKFLLWENFFLSPFYHLDEFHLVSNMSSFLWMGKQLETNMGSAEFAFMVPALLVLSQGITVLLSQILSLLGDNISYYDHHTVGFSGVLFAMKAVLTASPDLFMWLPGMLIPAKYTVWAELFLTRALIPKTSFLCHLGGLLAGEVYLWLKRSFKGQDPLSLLISGSARVVTSQVRFAQKLLKSVFPHGHVTARGRVGCHSSAIEGLRGLWRCSTCANYNSLTTDICEMCSTMREDCAFPRGQHHQAWFNGELSVEEIRRSTRECPRGLWRCSTCTNYHSLATDICEMCSTVREDCAFPRGQHHQAWCNGELSAEEIRQSARECPRGLWRCSTCTNYNSLATDICEMCSTMREDSAFARGQHTQSWGRGAFS